MLKLSGHKGRVCCLAYSPDGALLASGGEDKRVRLWGVAARREQRALKGHPRCVYGVAFSPDGRLLASCGGGKSLKLWEAGGAELGSLEGHTVLVGGVAFSPDGRTLASAGGDVFSPGFEGELLLWDVEGRRQSGRYPMRDGARAPAFSPDGQTLAWSGAPQTVTLRHLPSDTQRTLAQGTAVRGLAFSPDGATLGVATGWTVNVWDARAGGLRRTLRGHREVVWSVAFSPDGKLLLSGSEDGTVRLWEVASGRERASLDWQMGKVRAVGFAPDGMTAAAGGDGDVAVWDVDAG